MLKNNFYIFKNSFQISFIDNLYYQIIFLGTKIQCVLLRNLNIIFVDPFYINVRKYLTKELKFSFLLFCGKIYFKGKGFRIRKLKNLDKLNLNFGKSHMTKLLFLKYSRMWKAKKSKYPVIMFYSGDLEKLESDLKKVRIPNRYTKRGIRLKKQILKRRFGKVSQMISIYNR